MDAVFVQPVGVEVALDRRLRRGDALIVEERVALRDGEIFVAESLEAGRSWVGRWTAANDDDVEMFPLDAGGAPARLRRDALRVRGVVIGVRSVL